MNNNLFKGKKHQSFTLMITLCVQSDLGPNCMPTPFLVEQNCLCNSGRGHHEEHFCEIIKNLDHWLRRRCHLKTFLIMSSGNPCIKVSMGAKIRNRYNQVPHLTQDTNGKVTNSQPDTTKESQEVSPFSAGDHSGLRSAVGNVSGYRCVSDCRSRGREFDPGPVPYFCGD